MLPINNEIKNLSNTSTMILWELPQGIYADSNSTKDKGSEPARVLKPPKAGETCWLDVFQYMLHGAKPTMDDALVKIEKVAASFRDRLDVVSRTEQDLDWIKENFNFSTPDVSKNNLKQQCTPDVFARVIKLIDGFYAKENRLNFNEYALICFQKEKVSAYLKFFDELNISVLDYIPEYVIQTFYNRGVSTTFEEASLSIRPYIVNTVARAYMAKAYGLVRLTWNPTKGINALFEEVKKHGVIGFGGAFGRDHYCKDSHVVRKLNGRDIYGWGSGERQEESSAGSHYIGVVGVTKPTTVNAQGCVIYVDPAHGTDPQNAAQQRFHMISYASFVKNLFDEYSGAYTPEVFSKMQEALAKRNIPWSFGLLPNPSYFKK
jgi:hypothetical protein